MQFSTRLGQTKSAIFLDLDNKRKERLEKGLPVLNLSVGTPDLPPAPHVMKTLTEATQDATLYKYAIQDMPELIDAAMDWYKDRYQVSLSKNELMSLHGSQDGLAHVALSVIDCGETVLVPNPGYPIFSVGPRLASAAIAEMPLLEKNRYLIDFDAVPPSIAQQARMMIVSYPNNPVTATADMDFYERLVHFATKNDILVVHDNAYSELVLDGEPGHSFLEVPGARKIGVEFNSLSKSHNLTGLRISFALGNSDVIERLRGLKSHLDYGMFLPIQKAAISALRGPQDVVYENRLAYKKRRDALLGGFRDNGWQAADSPATMFCWCKIPEHWSSDVDFCMTLIQKTGVICVPGSSFGSLGVGYVRFALVQPEIELAKVGNLMRETGVL